jgi:phosphate/sulfate permease
LLQFDPLFKAAGMSRISLFWFLSPLLFFVWAAVFVLIAGVAGTSFDSLKGPKLTMFVLGLQAFLLFVSIMVGFRWCFKICIARGKRAWLGIFLILPLTNLLMLCYLAFSRGANKPRSTGQLKLA